MVRRYWQNVADHQLVNAQSQQNRDIYNISTKIQSPFYSTSVIIVRKSSSYKKRGQGL